MFVGRRAPFCIFVFVGVGVNLDMLKVTKDISDFAMSSQLGLLEVQVDKPVTFALFLAGIEIFSVVYQPDSSNRVNIWDLGSLMEASLINEVVAEGSYKLTADNETAITKKFHVQFCRLNMPFDASRFIRGYFLSVLAGHDKITVPGREESVAISTPATSGGVTQPVVVEQTFLSETLVKRVVSRTIATYSEGAVSVIPVSSSLFQLDGFNLLRYTVICGARRQTFRLARHVPVGTGFKFRNSFGVMEYCYLAGLVKVKPDFERVETRIRGELHAFVQVERREYTVSSGAVSFTEMRLIDDLVRSDQVFLLKGEQSIPVSIVDCDTSRSYDDHALHAVELTFVYAGTCPDSIVLPARIFDDTFDDTYE